jgi:hypothetical protein
MKFYTLAVVAFISISLSAQPTITSFSPLSATAGSIVTLNGTNFSANAEDNSIYFGIVKATVQAANATQLAVIVPTSASYSFISVTTGGLTAYSKDRFTLLLPGGANAISPSSFTPPEFNITEETAGGFQAAVADFDGDGKPDIFATRFNTLNVHRNTTTTPGQITFEKGGGTPAPALPTQISTGDLNGDGKLDVVSANFDFGTNYISVWLNTTASPGSPVAFSTRQDVSTAPYVPFGVNIHDMNADGKPDIVIANNDGTNDLTILTNTTSGSTFTYTTSHFAVTGGGGARKTTVADFDNDGRPDVAISNINVNRVHVLRNTTTGANITFAAKVDLVPSNTIFDITSADMNADGKSEIVTIGVNTPRAVSVFRNTSAGVGNINFAGRVDFTHPTSYAETVSIHDVDGDSKPDLVTSNYIIKNTSAGATISGEPAVAYDPAVMPGLTDNFLAMANDLDGDGIIEIIGFKAYSIGATYYSGIVVQDYIPQPRITSISPTSARLGETVTITGMYLSTATSVKFGNAAEVASFTINSSTSISAILTDATSGNIVVNSPIGPGEIGGFNLIPGPTVTTFSPGSGPVGTVVTITGANFGPTLTDNRVFFGAVRATVTEASATSLKAVVPVGYSEVPITVGVGIQTASALRPFRVTFAGGEAPFSGKSMSSPIKIGESVAAYSPAIGDFNSDNKPDIAAIGNGGIHVFFNTTANGVVTVSDPLTLTVPFIPMDVSVVDADGDGMQDIVVSGASLCVFLNTSTPAHYSFAAAKEFPQVTGNTLTIGDIDGDGRLDVISGNPTAYVARNLSYLGNINFASSVNLPGDFSGNSFAIADLDQDGRSEIVVPQTSESRVNVYPNVSTPAVLSLLTPIPVATQALPDYVSVSDLDGNNRPEIVVLSRTNGMASTIFNGSTPSLAFLPGATIDVGVMPTSGAAALGDINGDDNPDIALSNHLSLINLMKNTTPLGGSFTFETFSKSTDPNDYDIDKPILVDFDGNGELDIVGGKSASVGPNDTQSLTILRNQINEPYIDSFTPTRAGTGSVVTITGENFSGITGVSLGGTPVASFQIVSSFEIKVVIGSGASGNVSVTNGHFVTEREGFTFFNGPIITSFTPTSASSEDIVTITGIQFTGASGVSFGDVSAASFTVVSPTSITATPASGASGKVKVSNSFGSDELDGFTYIIVTGIEHASDIYAVEIFPNPSPGNEFSFRLNDSWNGKEIGLAVIDMMGKTVVSRQIVSHGENRWIAPAGQSLLPGLYFFSVVFSERTVVRKFIISR